ncbi:MAG: alpha/beta hydrolase [Pseudobdellovibrionaceae bacterium]
MSRFLYKFVLLAVMCCLLPSAGQAGLLRDKLKEFREKRQESSVSEDGPSPKFSDVPYGDEEKQAIDVYMPEHAVAHAPVIVMVHGGGWRHGDKAMGKGMKYKAAYYTGKGYIFISVNYRLLPDTPPDVQAVDVAKAVALVQKKAVSWGGDPARIVLMGHSAGAHLVALLSVHPAAWARTGLRPWAGTVVLDSAAIDLVKVMSGRHVGLYDDAFGDDKTYWTQNSPLHQLAADALPMLITCSSSRGDNPCGNAQGLVTKGKTLGKTYEILPADKNHGKMNQDVGVDPDYTASIDRFIESVIR